MLLLLSLLLAPGFCIGSGILQQVTLLRSVTVLACPHAGKDVIWSRVRNGEKLVLVSIREGQETRLDRRFGSQADGSLVITNTKASDETMYFCNEKHRVYLKVTSDPKEVPSNAPPEPGPQSHGEDSGLEEDLKEGSAEIQEASDWWKVPAGVLTGASLVLISIFILRFCSAKRTEMTDGKDQRVPEVVYEEIQVIGMLSKSSEVQGPLCCSQPVSVNLDTTREQLKGDSQTRIYDHALNPEEMSTKENDIYSSDP